MKNRTLITELKKFDPDTEIELQINLVNGVIEEGSGTGTWEGHGYTIEYTTDWNSGNLAGGFGLTVGDFIETLEDNLLSEFNQDTFSAEIGMLYTGYPDYTVTWDDELTEEELEDVPEDSELYHDAELDESTYNYSYPESIEITVLGDENTTFVLDADEEDDLPAE